jgi:hypothetical protein
MLNKALSVVAAGLSAILFMAPAAAALPIVATFKGAVDLVQVPGFGNVGDEAVFRFVYSGDVVDEQGGDRSIRGPSSLLSAEVSVGDLTRSIAPPPTQFFTTVNENVPGRLIARAELFGVFGDLIIDNSLSTDINIAPDTIPGLDRELFFSAAQSFGQGFFSFVTCDFNENCVGSVGRTTITSVSIQVVPIPPAIALIGSGLVLLGGLRLMRSRV